jgi:hypothetical protein
MFFLFSALDALRIDRAKARRPCAGSGSSSALVDAILAERVQERDND